MLGDNIRELRKQKGYSQETLAQQLNVVRQTVSKWEKGLSVPDAQMLEAMAELFGVPVSALLGGGIPKEEKAESNAVAEQLAILNQQLANRFAYKKRRFRRVMITLAVIAAVITLLYVLAFSAYTFDPVSYEETGPVEIITE